MNADGFAYDPGRVNAILVNAGVTHLSPIWLSALRAKGRMVVPMTLSDLWGLTLKTTRTGRNWRARFVSVVGIFPCGGGREDGAASRLEKALKRDDSNEVRSLRFEPHRRSRHCWLHEDAFCLSRLEP